MTEPENIQDLRNAVGVRRRIGFVAMLWWIAAGAGAIGLAEGLQAGWVRLLFVGISWVMAIFFSYAWWQVRKGRLPG
jgi:hypothetical protein